MALCTHVIYLVYRFATRIIDRDVMIILIYACVPQLKIYQATGNQTYKHVNKNLKLFAFSFIIKIKIRYQSQFHKMEFITLNSRKRNSRIFSQILYIYILWLPFCLWVCSCSILHFVNRIREQGRKKCSLLCWTQNFIGQCRKSKRQMKYGPRMWWIHKTKQKPNNTQMYMLNYKCSCSSFHTLFNSVI